MPAAVAIPALTETTVLADGFLSTLGITFEYNQYEVLKTALAAFIGALTEQVVHSTIQTLAARKPLPEGFGI